jgi:hypothetical protein
MRSTKKSDSSKKYKQQKQAWTAKRNVIVLVSLAVILLLVPLYYFFLWGEDNSTPVKPDKVVAARANNSSDEMRTRKLELLKATGAIKDVSPSYTSSYDFCTLGQDSEDWVIKSWYQTCSIKSTDLFETTLTRSEALEKLQSTNEVVKEFGSLRSAAKTCDIVYGNGFTGIAYLDFTVADADKSKLCDDSDFDIESPKDYYQEKVIHADDFSKIDRTKKYILVKQEANYFKQSIGCIKTARSSCTTPLNRPVTAFNLG